MVQILVYAQDHLLLDPGPRFSEGLCFFLPFLSFLPVFDQHDGIGRLPDFVDVDEEALVLVRFLGSELEFEID